VFDGLEGDGRSQEARAVFLASGSLGGYVAYWLFATGKGEGEGEGESKSGRTKCEGEGGGKGKRRSCCGTTWFFLKCYHLYLSLFLAPAAKTVTYPYHVKLLVVCCNLVISGALLALLPCGTEEQVCEETVKLQNSFALALLMAPFNKVSVR
jgi:hypothetical protein